MPRRDDINSLYVTSIVLDKICLACFILDCTLTVVLVFYDTYSQYITPILIVLAILYTILSLYDDGVAWYKAESARRTNSIQNAYGTQLSGLETNEYYNNNENNPDIKYALNVFESNYFTKRISEKMLLPTYIKAMVGILVLVVSCRVIKNDSLLLVIAQSVFSCYIVEEVVMLHIYTVRMSNLFEQAYKELVTVGISYRNQVIELKSYCLEYESVKAHYKIRVNESLFNKMNTDLSREWEALLNQIIIKKHIK
ncbi:MAG: hypothetical protein IKG35_01635 [Erysipelotrichaceae bacterium]|nr:hypothetical protein [Bacillus sp. (in: firmicutes)]MBR3350800.1 hypothetical protein [Erysipelotrichaceae bacterium]